MGSIILDNVSKKFPFHHQGRASVSRAAEGRDFWALRNVSCTIQKGELCGIVGRNGAGKTTLLHIVAGMIEPSDGRVHTEGKVACLFNLETGFQDELTGEENIFLNASLLGMSDAAVSRQLRDIVRFSELGEFIHRPLGTYSQGMRLRLGFSVAAHLDFDILVIDEVIMVGDTAFQQKCFEKMTDFRREGKTMLLTTQSVDLLERLSDTLLFLERGTVEAFGYSASVADQYRQLVANRKSLFQSPEQDVVCKTKWWVEKDEQWGTREGTKEVIIDSVRISDRWGREVATVKPGGYVRVELALTVREPVAYPHCGIALFRDDGVYVYGPNTVLDGIEIALLKKGKAKVSIVYPCFDLMPGRYCFSVVVWDKDELAAYDYIKGKYVITVAGAHQQVQLAHLSVRSFDRSIRPERNEQLLYTCLQNLPQWSEEKEEDDCVLRNVRCYDRKRVYAEDVETLSDLCISGDINCSPGDGLRYLWIGIFRSDGVLCHMHLGRIAQDGETFAYLYPKQPLLPGEYYCSIGVWDIARQGFLVCSHGIHRFAVISRKKDHGTLYLTHTWKCRFPK